MRKYIVCMLSIFLLSQTARAATKAASGRAGDFALGLILGSPTGLSGKYWMNESSAVDLALGFPFSDEVKLNFHMDYLWHFPIRAEEAPGKFFFFAGAGGRFRSIDKPKESAKVDFGVRLPLGMTFIPNSIPFEFFVELAPVIVFVPKGEMGLDGGIGARFRFPRK